MFRNFKIVCVCFFVMGIFDGLSSLHYYTANAIFVFPVDVRATWTFQTNIVFHEWKIFPQIEAKFLIHFQLNLKIPL